MKRLNVKKIKKDFPIFNRKIKGKEIVYLDSAATSQKPYIVIEKLKEFYEYFNSNVHRAIHTLSYEATQLFEETRKEVAKFINARPEEIIFLKNCTEAINLVANSLAFSFFERKNNIVTTIMEHHSNLVPWYLLKKRFGIDVKYVDINDQGLLKYGDFEKYCNKKTKLIALTHSSNMLGTINDIKRVKEISEKYGSLILIDGAQSVPHFKVNVKKIDCDFLAFSAHKMLGPTGVGILYGKKEFLEKMEPFLGGGEMIKEVELNKIEWNELPYKFEAGTPNFADVAAFKYAIEYLKKVKMENVRKNDERLVRYCIKRFSEIKNLEIYGPLNYKKRSGLISFNLKGIHAHDVSQILDYDGIAIRSGHHCTMPLHRRLNIQASCRASFYIYNQKEDVDKLVEGLIKIEKKFKI